MQDFLDDLRRRLEVARLEQQELEEYVKSLESLITIERKRHARASAAPSKPSEHRRPSHGPNRPPRSRTPSGQPSPVKAFLVRTMADGRQYSLEQLKRAAQEAGIGFDGKRPGPVLHFTLVALKNSEQATYDGRAKSWRLTEKATAVELPLVRGWADSAKPTS